MEIESANHAESTGDAQENQHAVTSWNSLMVRNIAENNPCGILPNVEQIVDLLCAASCIQVNIITTITKKKK